MENFTTQTRYPAKQLNEATLLADPSKKNNKWWLWCGVVALVAILFIAMWLSQSGFRTFVQGVNPVFYYFLAAGFLFAMIDGAIGMSYGVTSTTFSISMGIPPAVASMGVHLSEILSNGIAGWMHYRMGNINWKMFKLLLIPGIIGAVTGAYILSSLEHYSSYSKPFVSLYTLILGVVILLKAINTGKKRKKRQGEAHWFIRSVWWFY